MSFDQLGLQTKLLSAIEAQGYTIPTPIQSQAIPMILKGHDVMGGAQTGTGKTAAFTLPLLQILETTGSKGRYPRALIITPTRELAAQIGESVINYGKKLNQRSAVIFGGVNFNPQARKLEKGVDILVATPGRLLDHVRQKTLRLSHVEILVLDEADRMLDMGFIHDIRKILKKLPQKRQNLLFSATFPKQIKDLADGILHKPKLLEVARENLAAGTVAQVVHPVAHRQKRALLSYLITEGKWEQVLVFTRTKHGANRLCKQLISDGVSSLPIHGNKSQSARTKALSYFKNGEVRILVATDIAARGLDIESLPYVVNYDLPHVPEDYVHRIGRTGRAGLNGVALSLVCADDRKLLEGIEKLLKKKIPVEQIEGFKEEENAMEANSEQSPKTERNYRRKSSDFRKKTSGQAQNKNRGNRRLLQEDQKSAKKPARSNSWRREA